MTGEGTNGKKRKKQSCAEKKKGKHKITWGKEKAIRKKEEASWWRVEL